MYPLLQLVQLNGKQEKSFSVYLTVYHVYVRNILIFCTGLTMIPFLFGNVIECLNTNRHISQTYIDTKCYINGTFTKEQGHPTLYHDYYQWIPVYLALLAFGIHFPYSLWSQYYGNYLRYFEKLAEKPDEIIHLIQESKGNLIFFKTVALEIFYTIYLIWIVFVTDIFFNKHWSYFNWSWKAISKIFPDNGTCYIDYFQSSGISEEKLNCILPLCSVYRKIFTTLYVLVCVLLVINACMIINRSFLLMHRKEWVNVWWAFTIAEQCVVSWSMKEQINFAYKEMLANRKVVSSNIKMDTMV